ncbi:MAG: zinc ribbon domain-containing protein [Cyanothece sp. SIO2G6]|nr:zinc ribbon domain-containing protein [Cyanothece sp. SIO2G6]
MPTSTYPCPRCQKYIPRKAIACPHCHTPLKALGHAGIPLHQAAPGEVLCATCLYHQDDSCNYPQRPTAKDCIMYVDLRQPSEESDRPVSRPIPVARQMQAWVSRHLAWIILGGLVVISIWVVLSGG